MVRCSLPISTSSFNNLSAFGTFSASRMMPVFSSSFAKSSYCISGFAGAAGVSSAAGAASAVLGFTFAFSF
jgi:hypothetical protein